MDSTAELKEKVRQAVWKIEQGAYSRQQDTINEGRAELEAALAELDGLVAPAKVPEKSEGPVKRRSSTPMAKKNVIIDS